MRRLLRHVSWVLLVASAALSSAQYAPPKLAAGVGIDQKLNSPVPLDLVFRDEANRVVPLRTYFGDKPVLIELVYFGCTSLCPMTVHESVMALKRVSLEPGRDYEVAVVSFDPNDTPALAAEKKAEYASEFGRASFNAGWHFLTGTQDAISRLANAVGFRYRWDEATKQFVHAGGIMVATPEGKLSRYFYGIQYAPQDMRMALVDASKHKIGSPVDYVLLFCFHYDPATGKYTLAIVNLLKVAGCATVLALAGLLYFLMRNDRNKARQPNWKEAQHVG
ncbi:MAG: SCO family protein [Acidobacteriaceae bacterium]|nr:SCO family protein [Acidobacteriaceae bacterium]